MWTANLFFYTEICRFICSWHISLIISWNFPSQTVVWKYIVWQWTSSLLGFVNIRINREWQHFSLKNMQPEKESKRIEMVIKMVSKFKLAVVHFASPNPMCVDLLLDKKTVENQDWASWPPGHWAVAGRGLRATGPSSRQAAGPSWAVGLLLAKPLTRAVRQFANISRNNSGPKVDPCASSETQGLLAGTMR